MWAMCCEDCEHVNLATHLLTSTALDAGCVALEAVAPPFAGTVRVPCGDCTACTPRAAGCCGTVRSPGAPVAPVTPVAPVGPATPVGPVTPVNP